jgi:hypothetical protein
MNPSAFPQSEIAPVLLAQTAEELAQRGFFSEVLGWMFAILAFVVLIGGVIYGEMRKKKKDAAKPRADGEKRSS